MDTSRFPSETRAVSVERGKAFQRAKNKLATPLAALGKWLHHRVELKQFSDRLVKDTTFAEQVRHQYAQRRMWILWAIICLFSLTFDATFTFSSTAVSLRDGLSRLLPFVGSRLDFYVSLFLASTVLAITLCVRMVSDFQKEFARLETMPADEPEVLTLVATIKRKKFVRGGWAALLTVLLAAAALSELITVKTYEIIGRTAGSGDIGDAGQLAAYITHARMLQLVTPYAVTAVLHCLILFLNLPEASPFLPYPCNPNQLERRQCRVNRRVETTSRRIYKIVLAVPNVAARDQLVGIFSEDERAAINTTVGRVVFSGSFDPLGPPLVTTQLNN